MPKFQGPADVIEYNGKHYRRGDNVPMKDDEVEHNVVFGGLRFDGYDARTGRSVLPPPVMPFDASGHQFAVETPEVPKPKAGEPAATTVQVVDLTPPAADSDADSGKPGRSTKASS